MRVIATCVSGDHLIIMIDVALFSGVTVLVLGQHFFCAVDL